jgi:hypothetical protein
MPEEAALMHPNYGGFLFTPKERQSTHIGTKVPGGGRFLKEGRWFFK